MKRIVAAVRLLAAIALLLIATARPAAAGGMPGSPNMMSCWPLPSQAWIPNVDGSGWQILTSGSGTPGQQCLGVDYQLYVLACRLAAPPATGCTGVPTYVQVQSLWNRVWP